MKSCHLQQPDGSRGYYDKWNMSDKKTVWFPLYVEYKKQNINRVIDTENKQEFVRGERRERKKEIGKRY